MVDGLSYAPQFRTDTNFPRCLVSIVLQIRSPQDMGKGASDARPLPMRWLRPGSTADKRGDRPKRGTQKCKPHFIGIVLSFSNL